jgi:hypothetical protein
MPENENTTPPRLSKPYSLFAIASVIMLFVCFYCFLISFRDPAIGLLPLLISSVVMLSFCVLALIRILSKKSRGLALVIPSILTMLIIWSVVWFLNPVAFFMPCGPNLDGLGKAIETYASDYNNRMPTPSNWCDLLIEYADVSPGQLVCRASGSGKVNQVSP